MSFSSLQRIVEQNVDIPVPRGGVPSSRFSPRTEFNINDNNNPIWRDSVFLQARSFHLSLGVESCSLPRWWPNPIPAIPPYVVRTPHLHGAPATEETVLNSDTNASNKTYVKEIQENTKEETFF